MQSAYTDKAQNHAGLYKPRLKTVVTLHAHMLVSALYPIAPSSMFEKKVTSSEEDNQNIVSYQHC
jgi:hypothetical protein